MDYKSPIYTEKTVCQDCYKCVRNCPVKAIKIKDNIASVIKELCIFCGKCVSICPAGAKKIRNDINRAKNLLKIKKKVIASIAPSFLAEFTDIPKLKLLSIFKKLGFYGVSETALGAEIVSYNIKKQLNNNDFIVSSACPTIVEYIRKYKHNLIKKLSDLSSPLLAHCKILRKMYGGDIGIIFIGPCISKKLEADNNPLVLNLALTFKEFREWIKNEEINLNIIEESKENFIPYEAQKGKFYPIDGGMIKTLHKNISICDKDFINISGIDNIIDILNKEDILQNNFKFYELLSCNGGCISGHGMTNSKSILSKRKIIINNISTKQNKLYDIKHLSIKTTYKPYLCVDNEYSENMIKNILNKIGKYTQDDELNCGGCGYNTCRNFAKAILDGKAELNMCVSFMRQLAQKKANKLIQTMPSGVIIVDNKLQVIECNYNFVKLIGENAKIIYNNISGLQGANLKKIIPFYDIFEEVLETSNDILDKDIFYEDKILKGSIFIIEKNHIIGGIFQDITQPTFKKEQIIRQAQNVIQKNLKTVQQIAYLLGENASETEISLTSIIDLFIPKKSQQRGKNER